MKWLNKLVSVYISQYQLSIETAVITLLLN